MKKLADLNIFKFFDPEIKKQLLALNPEAQGKICELLTGNEEEFNKNMAEFKQVVASADKNLAHLIKSKLDETEKEEKTQSLATMEQQINNLT